MSVLSELRAMWLLYSIINRYRFDLVHAFTIKPVVYVSLILRFFVSRIKGVYSITGMGSLSLSDSLVKKIFWRVVEVLLRVSFAKDDSAVIFENSDDLNHFVNKKITCKNKSHLVNGAGVDTNILIPVARAGRRKKIIVVFLARLLKDKGIMEFANAAKILNDKKVNVTMQIVGSIDENNISSINKEQLASILKITNVEYLGFRNDIHNVYSFADIACLPSYREGLPKSLIEACSCGLPIITTDTPGCRQIIDEEFKNGLIVPIRNSVALANAIEKLVSDSELREKYGANSRYLAVHKYDFSVILSSFCVVYEAVLRQK